MGKQSEHKIYEFDDFRLDSGNLMLYRGDDELPLAPKAVETLLALVERKGEIISKDVLLETIWPDAVVEEANLFLYLSVLRKTLGKQKNGQPWVETHRRRGYRFSGSVRLVTEANGIGAPSVNTVPTVPLVPPPTPSDGTTKQDEQGSQSRLKQTAFATAAVIAVVAGLAFTYWYVVTPSIGSVAVMPLVNQSGEATLDYLSDGMTEELIANLSREPNLQVKASASVARYRGSVTDVRIIGDELGVQAVLYGRVVQRGEDLELRLELIDVQTQNRLWDRTYNRRMSNLPELQADIARDVVRRLRARLLGWTERDLAKNYTENGEAFNRFLLGRFHFRKLTRPQIQRGISYFDQAIELDPSYALAYAAKAEAYRGLALGGEMPPGETFANARASAQKALEIDPDLAEGHAGLGGVAFFHDWNFAQAEKLFLKALELDPNSSMAHMLYGDFLQKMGRKQESQAQLNRARELEPLSPFLNVFASGSVQGLGPDESLRRLNIAIDLDPTFYLAHTVAGAVYRAKKMYPEAISQLRLAKQLSPDQTWSDVILVRTLVLAGRNDEARALVEELVQLSRTRFVPPYHLAAVHYQLGDADKALAYLEDGLRIRDPKMVFWNQNHWDESDPRFLDIKRRIGF